MRWSEAGRAAAWLLTAAVLPSCAPPEPAEGGSGDEYVAALEAASEEAPADTMASTDAVATLADRRSDRRAMEQVDAAFPHSEHRELTCQRCHRRPPGHETHRGAACTACHGQPVEFSGLPDRTAAECAGCHHADVGAEECRSCHSPDAVGPRPVLVSIQPAGADQPTVRRLSFDHADHDTRSCTVCHTARPTLRFDRSCASCHAAHHREEAQCTTCHGHVDTPAHDAGVHAGCAGSSCHESSDLPALVPTRSMCLTCHQPMADHKPGRVCTACHTGSWLIDTRGAGRSGR